MTSQKKAGTWVTNADKLRLSKMHAHVQSSSSETAEQIQVTILFWATAHVFTYILVVLSVVQLGKL